jgi:hypothetical protein
MQVQETGVWVVTAGGMAGRQITLMAVGAAVFAAAVAVRLDRALTARRATRASDGRSRLLSACSSLHALLPAANIAY